jgi:hypothetical protein
MSFDEKIMGGKKIENLPIILEAKLSLYVTIYFESLLRKYTSKSLVNDDGTLPEHIFFAVPKRYVYKLKKLQPNNTTGIVGLTAHTQPTYTTLTTRPSQPACIILPS